MLKTEMMKKNPGNGSVTVYQPRSLGGVPLSAEQIKAALGQGRDSQPFRALVQLIEAQAALMQADAQKLENQVNGTSGYYVSRAAALSDLLVKVQEYAWPELMVELKEGDFV